MSVRPATSEPQPATAEASAEEPEPPSRALRPAAADIALEIVEEAGDWSRLPALDTEIRAAANALVQHAAGEALKGRAATIALSDDASVRALNGAYRGKDQPTNILSFPFEAPAGIEDAEARDYLGDIALACETVLREADEMGIPPSHHLQHLIVHGLLHLLGHDHVEDDEAERMEAIETEVLRGLGIAEPYAV